MTRTSVRIPYVRAGRTVVRIGFKFETVSEPFDIFDDASQNTKHNINDKTFALNEWINLCVSCVVLLYFSSVYVVVGLHCS